MPLTFYELADSRKFSVTAKGARETLRFLAFPSNDENEVYTAALAATSDYFDNLIRSDVTADPRGGGVWLVEVEYSATAEGGGALPVGSLPVGEVVGQTPTDPSGPASGPAATANLDPQTLGYEVAFDFVGQTRHITQSRETVYRRTAADDPEDLVSVGSARSYDGAIGVTKDSVAGCDVFAPHIEMTVTIHRSFFTLTNLRTLASLIGTTNNGTWWGFSEGDVLYLGGHGQSSERGKWVLSHKFGISFTEENVPVGGAIFLPRVRGWEYVWVTYETLSVGGRLVQVPDAAYVEKVYKPGNFSSIEIGT